METKINDMEKPTEEDQDKPLEELKSSSWKTSVDLWSKIPLLIFLSIICTNAEVNEKFYCSTGIEIFQLIPLSVTLILVSLYIAYSSLIDEKKFVKILRSLYSGSGVLTVVYCIINIGKLTVDKFFSHAPFYYGKSNYHIVSWQELLDTSLFEIAGLIINFGIMVIISGICPWLKDEGKEKEGFKQETWQQKIYSIACKLVIGILLITMCLSLTTTFATTVVRIFYWTFYHDTLKIFGHAVAISRILWIIVIVAGAIAELFAFRYYWKKMNDFTTKISTSYSSV